MQMVHELHVTSTHFNGVQAIPERARSISLTFRKEAVSCVVFKGIGPALSPHGLPSHGLGLELKNFGLRVTLERLSLELATDLIQKTEMASAAELPE